MMPKNAPVISILIPFYRESPKGLIHDLTQCALSLEDWEKIELICLDDGSNDERLTRDVSDALKGANAKTQLISLAKNEGRARGRNQLTKAANGQYFLFLDADMSPKNPDFLKTWLDYIAQNTPAVCFGGFLISEDAHHSDYTVHAALSRHSDTLDAKTRSLQPEKNVFTSNLLVRRDVFEAVSFDNDFTGWGWEDVEWGMRCVTLYPISHIDNEAYHLGLDKVESLLKKFTQSGPNFKRVYEKHPDLIKTYPSFRAANKLKNLPFLGLLTGFLAFSCKIKLLPINMRALCLRLYRITIYAKALKA